MSRPETIADVTDRFIRFANIEVDKFINNPKLLKAYTTLIEQVTYFAGEVNTTYGTNVELTLPRTTKQLEEQLRSDQYSWDDKRTNYLKMLDGEEVAEWRHSSLKEWAKAEGLPDPSEGENTGLLVSEEEAVQALRNSVPVK